MQKGIKDICRGAAIFALFASLSGAWQYCKLSPAVRARDQAYVWGRDSNFYFAWGRSLAVDGDLDFRNDFGFVAGLRGFGGTRDAFADYLKNEPIARTGMIANKYAAGTGFFAVPWLLAARGIAAIHERLHGTSVSPFAGIYAVAFAAGNAACGIAGMFAGWAFLIGRFGKRTAGLAVAAIFFGTPLLHYIVFEPEMAHATASAFVVFFIIAACSWSDSTANKPASARRRAFAAGMLLGACMMVRLNLIVLAAVPLALRFRAGDRRQATAGIAVFAAGAAAGFMPQMFAWKQVYGGWLADTYVGEEMRRWPVSLGAIMFGTRAGLFLWTPLALLAFGGLAAAAVRRDRLACGGVVALALPLGSTAHG